MKQTLLNAFATLNKPDLNFMNDEGLSISRVRTELLSGLTVDLAINQEDVAFAFVDGVHPFVGL